nr:RNA-directed DNA polymerase, eukaryota [Tanacetum cinerariifolium]
MDSKQLRPSFLMLLSNFQIIPGLLRSMNVLGEIVNAMAAVNARFKICLQSKLNTKQVLKICKSRGERVNGSLTAEFQFHRGLKQGDPLVPFLFILVMESLHLSFSRAVEARIFTGIKIDSSLTLSHLFYADDAVFIGEWSDETTLLISALQTPVLLETEQAEASSPLEDVRQAKKELEKKLDDFEHVVFRKQSCVKAAYLCWITRDNDTADYIF